MFHFFFYPSLYEHTCLKKGEFLYIRNSVEYTHLSSQLASSHYLKPPSEGFESFYHFYCDTVLNKITDTKLVWTWINEAATSLSTKVTCPFAYAYARKGLAASTQQWLPTPVGKWCQQASFCPFLLKSDSFFSIYPVNCHCARGTNPDMPHSWNSVLMQTFWIKLAVRSPPWVNSWSRCLDGKPGPQGMGSLIYMWAGPWNLRTTWDLCPLLRPSSGKQCPQKVDCRCHRVYQTHKVPLRHTVITN